jgi:glutamate carboxypeptidase
VVAPFTSTGKGKVLLVAHIDTVFKPGTAIERRFHIGGGRAYGPGVCDDTSSHVSTSSPGW